MRSLVRWDHGGVSYPGPQYPPPGWGISPVDPGPIPLRPLTAGDLLGTAFGVVRRHLAVLGPLAVLVAVLASAARLGILAGSGTLADFASGTWYAELWSGLQAGRAVPIPAALYVAAEVSSLISVIGAIAVSGIAAACAGVDAMGRHAVRGALAERLKGRIGPLLVTAALAGIAVSVGLLLLVVPGVLLYVTWAAAAPVAAMERSGPPGALARSARLTRGHRGRIFGMTLLILIITFAIEVLVSSAAQAAAGTLSPLGSLILSDAVTALVAAVTTSWVGAVIALLYIDIRVRNENLGPALRAFAAGDGVLGAGGPALGRT